MPSRKSVNLTVEDERVLAPFLEEGTGERDELLRMVSEDSVASSDSAALTALARLGARVVRDRILERGYAELAAQQDQDDEEWTSFSADEASQLWDES